MEMENRDIFIVEGKVGKDQSAQVEQFKSDFNKLRQGVSQRSCVCDVSCTLGVGTPMVPLVDVANAKSFDETTLEHDGKVWLIDFWATWCPPCQAPMKHNDQMLEKHADWKDQVRILGISIDQESHKVMPHVEKFGYGRVEHYLKASSQCDKDYGVQGVPHVALVDKKGVI
jgi:thiol-disulfide isomerase/thioredoxin